MLLDEQLLRLDEVPAILPKNAVGRRVHYSTVYRWSWKGIICRNGERVRLEIGRVGGTIYTSREAVGRFIERAGAADQQGHEERFARQERTPRRRLSGRQGPNDQAIEAAEAELSKAGI
jgi:hypothetical protein